MTAKRGRGRPKNPVIKRTLHCDISEKTMVQLDEYLLKTGYSKAKVTEYALAHFLKGHQAKLLAESSIGFEPSKTPRPQLEKMPAPNQIAPTPPAKPKKEPVPIRDIMGTIIAYEDDEEE